ncbi:flavin monoamine oxidase family protein [Phreatobacter oligotrophus]|uniref:Tryptophan 2-monooxygenase n=1 Tax=Phreatobacter oligotrophus TaxID=1122261 RepID=A0A2T4YYU7_9HYPH|nr:NAD(P)/FAD-dependent oxidoreductase [Phreatobacter oligotrophus]PTM51889.1 monoamine oxidase [Phreatobacter oligotrophus]
MTRRRLLAASATLPAAPALAQTARQPASEVDVIVIGAGAAGIAAARRLTAAGRSVIVLEAKAQAGGRCIVDTVNFGMPMDLGAHWIHAPADNPVVPLARAAGFTLYDDPDRPRLMIKGRSPREGEWETFAAALVRAQRAIIEAGEAGREIPLSAAMPTNLRDWAATIDFLKGAWDSGKETSEISCVDFYNAIETRDLFCRQGYGAILAKLAEGLPIRLSTPVTKVDWSGRGVTVETPAGALRARAVIVTVSTAVLASGTIRFTPALPKRQADAVAALTCGTYEHLIVRLAGNPLDAKPDEPLVVKADTTATAKPLARIGGSDWWYLDIGGRFARDLAAAGETAMKAFAAEFVGNEFGPQARRALGEIHVTSWSTDPFIRGAWSVAGPGATPQRLRLAEPVGQRLLIAGEATDEGLWGTVGGAFASGERAAEQALRWIAPAAQGRRR